MKPFQKNDYDWKNTIPNTKDRIFEEWLNKDLDMGSTSEPNRVVFLKNAGGQYEFIGVFKVEDVDKTTRIKKYARVSSIYEIKN